MDTWTPSDYVLSDYASWTETRTMILGTRTFELGTSRRDCGWVPRSGWLIFSDFLSKTDMSAKEVKFDPNKIWFAQETASEKEILFGLRHSRILAPH